MSSDAGSNPATSTILQHTTRLSGVALQRDECPVVPCFQRGWAIRTSSIETARDPSKTSRNHTWPRSSKSPISRRFTAPRRRARCPCSGNRSRAGKHLINGLTTPQVQEVPGRARPLPALTVRSLKTRVQEIPGNARPLPVVVRGRPFHDPVGHARHWITPFCRIPSFTVSKKFTIFLLR